MIHFHPASAASAASTDNWAIVIIVTLVIAIFMAAGWA